MRIDETLARRKAKREAKLLKREKRELENVLKRKSQGGPRFPRNRKTS